MASLIGDGPKMWVIDTIDRKLSRVVAVGAGSALLAWLFMTDSDVARLVALLGAVSLFRAATMRPPRPVPVRFGHVQPITTDDLAELDNAIIDLRSRHDALEDRVDRFAGLMADASAFVSEGADRLRKTS